MKINFEIKSLIALGKEVVETVTPKVKPSVQCIGVEVKHSGKDSLIVR